MMVSFDERHREPAHLHVHATAIGKPLLGKCADAVFSDPKYLLGTRRIPARPNLGARSRDGRSGFGL
jgi:hypothetical protein